MPNWLGKIDMIFVRWIKLITLNQSFYLCIAPWSKTMREKRKTGAEQNVFCIGRLRILLANYCSCSRGRSPHLIIISSLTFTTPLRRRAVRKNSEMILWQMAHMTCDKLPMCSLLNRFALLLRRLWSHSYPTLYTQAKKYWNDCPFSL